jgi:hypothetical protein
VKYSTPRLSAARGRCFATTSVVLHLVAEQTSLADLKQRSMMPVREPLRSLIYCGAERAVGDAFVDGEQAVVEGHLARIDLDSALAEVEVVQERGSKNIVRGEKLRVDLTGYAHECRTGLL